MAVARFQPTEIVGGDYWAGILTVTGDDDTTIDLPAEGWAQIRAQWVPAPGSDATLQVDVDDTQAGDGVIGLSMPADRTAQMPGDGLIFLQSLDGAGRPTTRLIIPTRWTAGGVWQ